MKHAGREAIAQIEPLLAKIRKHEALREKRPGVFYLKSRAFLHFHEDPRGLFVDIKLADDFSRFPVNTEKQRAHLLERVARFITTSAKQ